MSSKHRPSDKEIVQTLMPLPRVEPRDVNGTKD